MSIRRGLFNTRSRPEHTRKRKLVSHIFSHKNVLEFEVNARMALTKLIEQWDRMCDGGTKDLSGREGEGGWFGRDGRVWFDCLPWYNYLAFDIIGDLAFGAPFGMLDAGKDVAPVAVTSPGGQMRTIHIPAVKILNSRGDYSASIGVLPPWVRPLITRVPWYARGNQAVQHLAGLAIAAVEKRLADPSAGDRGDLLAKLRDGKDEEGNPMSKAELTAEALTQLIAGSDTTSKYHRSSSLLFTLTMRPVLLVVSLFIYPGIPKRNASSKPSSMALWALKKVSCLTTPSRNYHISRRVSTKVYVSIPRRPWDFHVLYPKAD